MKVELLNPEIFDELFYNWGETSSVCYDTHGREAQVGRHCLKSGHFSGSRGDYIKFKITEVPRFVIDQAVRHEVGVFKNVQSFRYVDKDGFKYSIPKCLDHNAKLKNEYIAHMKDTEKLYDKIQDYVRSTGRTNEEANEQARYVLPMSTESAFVIGFTLEALIHFMHKRLCSRAEKPIRDLAILMRNAVLDKCVELNEYLVPECEYLMWCPEGKRGCGYKKSKKEIQETLNFLGSNIINTGVNYEN